MGGDTYNISDCLVFIMDSSNMNTQAPPEKLTHKITVCVTEDDWRGTSS